MDKDLINKFRNTCGLSSDSELKELYSYFAQLNDLVKFLPLEFNLFKGEIGRDYERLEGYMITRNLLKL